jgi:hypothetical protein
MSKEEVRVAKRRALDDAIDSDDIEESSSTSNNVDVKRKKIINPQQTSALLNRLQAFLPRIQKANQELLESSNNADTSSRQIDVDLGKEDDDSSSSDDGDSSSESVEEKDKINSKKSQTIQIQFEVGDVQKNPLINLLADGAQEEDDDKSQSESDDVGGGSDGSQDQKDAASKLLSKTPQVSENSSRPLISVLKES